MTIDDRRSRNDELFYFVNRNSLFDIRQSLFTLDFGDVPDYLN